MVKCMWPINVVFVMTLLSSGYPLIIYTHPVAGNLPIYKNKTITKHCDTLLFHNIIYVDENAPRPCILDITALFKEFATTSVVEATPDFLEIPHTGSVSVPNH